MKIMKFISALLVTMLCAVPCLAEDIAQPSDAAVTVNGVPVQINAYNLYGNNYFKLRDVAAALNGTDKQFDVIWREGYGGYIDLIGQAAYEMETENSNVSEVVKASVSVPEIYASVDGVTSARHTLVGYNVADNNYFKIRDIARIFDFNVSYTDGILKIDTSKSYDTGAASQIKGEFVGKAYEASMPLFINEMPVVSYYSSYETAYDEIQLERVNKMPRLNGVYINVKDLGNYGFEITETETDISVQRNNDKEFVPLDTEIINNAPDKEYKIYGAAKNVYLDGEIVRSVVTDTGEVFISAIELTKYGDIEKFVYINGFNVPHDRRINIDFFDAELNELYDAAEEEPEKSSYTQDDMGMSFEYKPSVRIGKIHMSARSEKFEYIGGIEEFSREGRGIYRYQYNPTAGAGLAPTRYTLFERGVFANDTLYEGISYSQITYGGEFGGDRIEGARVNGYQRIGTVMRTKNDYNLDMNKFRFGYRIVCEGEIKDGEYSGAYKAYDENGDLVYDGPYSDYIE